MRYLYYILLSFLLLLTACQQCGNGDGYAGRCSKPSAPGGDIAGVPSDDSNMYYWHSAGFTCVDTVTSLSVPSYKDKVEIREGAYVSLGTLCTPHEIILPTDEIDSSFTSTIFGYQDRIYAQGEETFTFVEADTYPEVWCKGADDVDGQAVVYRRFGTADYTGYFFSGFTGGTTNLDLSFLLSGTLRTYENDLTEVKVDTSTSLDPLTTRYDGEIGGQAAKCRFTPPT